MLCHMGEKHGRIIQASLHGNHLVLQFSPLWSFGDDKTAPVELFVRYAISEIVRLETLDLGIPSLGEGVASMCLDD